MEPPVRKPRIESAIVAPRLEWLFLPLRNLSFRTFKWPLVDSKQSRQERNFLRQRPEAKNPPKRPLPSAETGNVENRRQETPQKPPLFDRRRIQRFGKTGWWCAQSYANRSPCYLVNIRVIFEKNSDPAAESAKNACSAGISRTSREFNNREEQGAIPQPNSERALIGLRLRTH